MAHNQALVLMLCFLLTLQRVSALNSIFMLSSYAPSMTSCPAGNSSAQSYLNRPAEGLSADEEAYRNQRMVQASDNLRQWLQQFHRNDSGNMSFNLSGHMPVVAMASSGGGTRSLLTGAGVVQAFDNRDTNTSVGGLYQALMYHTGHEAGARLVTALAANNYPRISQLKTLWTTGFRNEQWIPLNRQASAVYSRVVLGMAAKSLAGFDVSLVDAYGGILSYQMLYAATSSMYSGDEYSFTTSMSGIQLLSNFTSHNAPLPIVTVFGIQPVTGQYHCYTADLQTHEYEFNPYEFGSWDYGIRSFTDVKYLGTDLDGGGTLSTSSCIIGLDDLALIAATSSDNYNFWCSTVPNRYMGGSGGYSLFNSEIAGLTGSLHPLTYLDEYTVLPNPFYNFPYAPQVSADQKLYLVGGNQGSRDVPLWPLIQPARGVDVIIANDNSDVNGQNNLPNGTQIYGTYQRALQFGITRMPVIPNSENFMAHGLNQQSMTVFGCDDPNAITIIYIPNRPISFPSNQSRIRLVWGEDDVNAMIANGVQIGQGVGANGPEWGSCMACMLMKKVGGTPDWCEECFQRWCWRDGQDAGSTV